MNPARPSFICASCARALRTQTKATTTTITRQFQSAPTDPEPSEPLPRWKQTPPAMKMPIRLRPQPNKPVWRVNTDEEKLDAAYDRFLGSVGGYNTKGRDLLDEEIKWLAVTHKSFDHGRRGFNDRLAFLGKRVVDLQTSLALLSAPSPPELQHLDPNDVFQHAALEGVENITPYFKARVLAPSRLAALANQYGIDRIVRWKPKNTENLKGSGVDAVMAHTLYSIVGALSLQQGGELAAKTTRERILQPLGLR